MAGVCQPAGQVLPARSHSDHDEVCVLGHCRSSSWPGGALPGRCAGPSSIVPCLLPGCDSNGAARRCPAHCPIDARMEPMIVVTTNEVPGYRVEAVMGE